MTLAPGARLGSYEILSAIGGGGMGEVYAAQERWRKSTNDALSLMGPPR